MYSKSTDNNAILTEAGLTVSEQSVYMAGLDQEGMTSAELIAKTRRPRQTVMAALKRLQEFDLCRTIQLDGRSYSYEMQPATNLKQTLGAQIREIDSLIESLELITPAKSELSIKKASGQKEVQALIELALRCKSRRWHIISPYDNALRHMPKSYVDYFKRVRGERQIKSQTLWDSDWSEKDVSLNDLLMRKPRYVPKNLAKKVPSFLLAFDDYLLAIEGQEHPEAVLARSQAVADTYRLVFELAWRACR